MTARRMFVGWSTPDKLQGVIAAEYHERCARVVAATGRRPDMVTLVDHEHVLIISADAEAAAAWCETVTRAMCAMGAEDDPAGDAP
jgi:hypothetical protein